MQTVLIVEGSDADGASCRRHALERHAPPGVAISVATLPDTGDAAGALGDEAPDMVVLLDAAQARAMRIALVRRRWPTRLVTDWRSGWPERVESLASAVEHSDHVVFNNHDYWRRAGSPARSTVITDGVDLTVFAEQVPVAEREAKVLWIGERERDHDGFATQIMHLRNELRVLGIEMDCRAPGDFESPRARAGWYNTGLLLVSAERFRGHARYAFEAAACGCAVVAARSGNLEQLIENGVNGYLVDRNTDALLQGVETALGQLPWLARRMRAAIEEWGEAERARAFFEIAASTLAGPARGQTVPLPEERRDLSREVTVFVSTVGARTFRSCLAHLRRQDVRFEVRVLDRVAPLSAALETMARECTTPYWIQVDEDMLLYENAVGALHARIEELGERCAICVGNLYDVHLARCIRGVKIFRHAVAARYPVADAEDGVKRRHDRMLADGYSIDGWDLEGGTPLAGGTFGVHGTHWTSASIYSRYFSLERRRRRHPDRYGWFDAYHDEFLQRMIAEPTELNFFALMGVVGGARSDLATDHGSSHFRDTPALQGLEDLQRYYLDAVSSREHPVPLREHSPDY